MKIFENKTNFLYTFSIKLVSRRLYVFTETEDPDYVPVPDLIPDDDDDDDVDEDMDNHGDEKGNSLLYLFLNQHSFYKYRIGKDS